MKTKMPPRNIFIGIWILLVFILFTMFGIAQFSSGRAGTAVILGLAVTQMLLVIAFFMRLRESTRMVRISAGAGFLWLFFLFVLALSDYLTRQWH